MKNNDLDLGFKTFFCLFKRTLNKHAPKEEGTKKDKKIEMKLCIIKGIKMSMIKRDKLYRKMVKAKNSQVKIENHKSYKNGTEIKFLIC